MIALVLEDHPDRAATHFGGKLARRLARHGSIASRVGASDEPGAVHSASADRRIQDLGREIADADQRLSRLYKAIEEGTIDGSDPTLKERISNLRETRDRATGALDYARRNAAASLTVDPVAVETFIRMIRERLTSGDTGARKAWIGAVVDAVIIGDGTIRHTGIDADITAAAGGKPEPNVGRIRNSVRVWCG